METITFSDGTKYTFKDIYFLHIKHKNDLDLLFAKFQAPLANKHKIVNYTNHLYYWKFSIHYNYQAKEKEYRDLIEKNQDLQNNQLVKNWFFGILDINPEEKLKLLGKVHPLHVCLKSCTPENFCGVTEDEFLQILKKNFPHDLESVFSFDEILTFAKGKNSNMVIELLIKNGYHKIIEILKPKLSPRFLDKFYSKNSRDIHYSLFKYLTPGQKEEFADKLKPLKLQFIQPEDFKKYFKDRVDELPEIWKLMDLEPSLLTEVIKVIGIINISPYYILKLKEKIDLNLLSDALYPWDE
jgi:hypothetical protein